MARNPYLGDAPRIYLREWRIYRRLTQKELAAKIGAKSQALSKWERLERRLTLGTMYKLFAALDIMPGQLFAPPETVDLNWFARNKNQEQRRRLIDVLEAHTGQRFSAR